MEKNLTILETEISRVSGYLGELAGPETIKIIAERNLGVEQMDEISAKGILTKKEEALSKNNKPFFKLTFTQENNKTLSGSCFEAGALTGISLGMYCEVVYTQNAANGKTYNNFSKVTKLDSPAPVVQAPAAVAVQQTLPSNRDEIIDLAGCRNNASELIAAIISTSKTPEEAQTVLVDLLNQQYHENLTKTLFNSYKKVKEDVL